MRDRLGSRQQTLAVELRVRSEGDLDACEQLAHVVHAADGCPPRCADDLRVFLSATDALGAWMAESKNGIIGHVALLPRSSPAVMAAGRRRDGTATRGAMRGSPALRLANRVERRDRQSLLALAADADRARGVRPILDVAAHLDSAIRLYERAGWMCGGQVTVDFHQEAPLEALVYIGPDPGSMGL